MLAELRAGIGITDFAGSMIVHMTGGIGALSGVIVLGPRKGRFEDPKAFEPHSLPLVVLGTMILWILGIRQVSFFQFL